MRWYQDSKLRFKRAKPTAGHRQRPGGEAGSQPDLGFLAVLGALMWSVYVWVIAGIGGNQLL